ALRLVRGPRDRDSRLRLATRSQPGAETLLPDGRVLRPDVGPGPAARSHRAARRTRIPEHPGRMADPAADAAPADRSDPARIYAYGAVRAAIQSCGVRVVRTRYLLPVDSARASVYGRRDQAGASAIRVSARDSLRAEDAAGMQSHPGVHGRKQALPRRLSSRPRATHR